MTNNSNKDRVEFYVDDRLQLILNTSIVPPPESLISIRGETYQVTGVTYAVDYADDTVKRNMRANVDMVKI